LAIPRLKLGETEYVLTSCDKVGFELIKIL